MVIVGQNTTESGKRRAGSVMGEDSLLERVTAAAEERQLSHNSLKVRAVASLNNVELTNRQLCLVGLRYPVPFGIADVVRG